MTVLRRCASSRCRLTLAGRGDCRSRMFGGAVRCRFCRCDGALPCRCRRHRNRGNATVSAATSKMSLTFQWRLSWCSECLSVTATSNVGRQSVSSRLCWRASGELSKSNTSNGLTPRCSRQGSTRSITSRVATPSRILAFRQSYCSPRRGSGWCSCDGGVSGVVVDGVPHPASPR